MKMICQLQPQVGNLFREASQVDIIDAMMSILLLAGDIYFLSVQMMEELPVMIQKWHCMVMVMVDIYQSRIYGSGSGHCAHMRVARARVPARRAGLRLAGRFERWGKNRANPSQIWRWAPFQPLATHLRVYQIQL